MLLSVTHAVDLLLLGTHGSNGILDVPVEESHTGCHQQEGER